jgi:hypothetical protein
LGHHEAGVGDELPVSAEGGRGAVEDGGFGYVGCVEAPVPVREGTRIAAGVEAVFVFLDVPPVPGEEGGLV